MDSKRLILKRSLTCRLAPRDPPWNTKLERNVFVCARAHGAFIHAGSQECPGKASRAVGFLLYNSGTNQQETDVEFGLTGLWSLG